MYKKFLQTSGLRLLLGWWVTTVITWPALATTGPVLEVSAADDVSFPPHLTASAKLTLKAGNHADCNIWWLDSKHDCFKQSFNLTPKFVERQKDYAGHNLIVHFDVSEPFLPAAWGSLSKDYFERFSYHAMALSVQLPYMYKGVVNTWSMDEDFHEIASTFQSQTLAEWLKKRKLTLLLYAEDHSLSRYRVD